MYRGCQPLQENVVQRCGIPPVLCRQGAEVDGIVANGPTALLQAAQLLHLLPSELTGSKVLVSAT